MVPILLETITWGDETLHVCISEFINPHHIDNAALLELAAKQSESVLAVQFFDSSMIVDELHLLSATQNAYNALKGGYMKSRNLDVEIALYASAQHQIGVALKLMGISDGTKALDVLVLGEDKSGVEDCMAEINRSLGTEVQPAFVMTEEKIEKLMEIFRVEESELALFLDQEDLTSRQRALSRCVVSRVSQVAITG